MSVKQIVHADGPALKQYIACHDLVMVDFWAAWCAPCRAMVPMLDRLAGDFPDLHIVKVDAEVHTDLLDEYQIRSLPTLQIYRSSRLIEQLVGKAPYAILHRAVLAAG